MPALGVIAGGAFGKPPQVTVDATLPAWRPHGGDHTAATTRQRPHGGDYRLDHRRLAYGDGGRDWRLTDVDGNLIRPLLRQA